MVVNRIIGYNLIKFTIVKIVNISSTSKNIRKIKKVRREDNYFSTISPYADKRIGEINYSIVNTFSNSTQNMIKKSQSLKAKTKLQFFKTISIYYNETNIRRQSGNFQFEECPFSKNVQGIGKIYHEVL